MVIQFGDIGIHAVDINLYIHSAVLRLIGIKGQAAVKLLKFTLKV
jgi:hypothetical protein